MGLLIYNYEEFLHHNNSYSRTRYVRNQGLGFSALTCFWVISGSISVSLTLAK